MIFVIFLTGVVILLISILCIRFMLSLQMERDRREVGMLKALGVGKAEIFKIYFAKYILLSACGGLIGFLTACVLKEPLAGQMRELYGILADGWKMTGMSLAVVFFTEGIILFAVMHSLKKTSRISALEALFSAQERKMGRGRYWIIGFVSAFCTFLALVPRNLYSTMSDPKFVTYMGIGDGEIRMDVRQTQDMDVAAGQITSALALDPGVEKYVALSARSCKVILTGGEMVNITVETGDHNIFPVYRAVFHECEGIGFANWGCLAAGDRGTGNGVPDLRYLSRYYKRRENSESVPGERPGACRLECFICFPEKNGEQRRMDEAIRKNGCGRYRY